MPGGRYGSRGRTHLCAVLVVEKVSLELKAARLDDGAEQKRHVLCIGVGVALGEGKRDEGVKGAKEK